MQEAFAGRVDLIGIAGASNSADAMEAFVAETGVGGFDHIQDLDNEIWQRYEVRTQPTFVFIDDDGSQETAGGLGMGELTARIDALLSN